MGTTRVGVAGIALVAAALTGFVPTMSVTPVLAADSYYLPGTRIGDFANHQAPLDFTRAMMSGADLEPPAATDFHFVDYPASIWPFSAGGLGDPKWDASVAQGVANLGEQPAAGDTVFGYSQGAVVATAYKRDHLGDGVNYVLVENPGRPNGGIMQRFKGLRIPLLDIAFTGATPVVRDPAPGGGATVDIARQYDGWADFPKYPLNLLSTVNAVLGILYLHGDTQDLGPAAVAGIDKTDPRYFQQHGDTTYYLIPTARLPLLMPLQGLLPRQVLDALDSPLRKLVELGYDRSDYSRATGAQLLPPLRLPSVTARVPAQESARDSAAPQAETVVQDDPDPKPTVRKPTLTATPRQAAESVVNTQRSADGSKGDRHETDRRQTDRHETGRHETGRHETGRAGKADAA